MKLIDEFLTARREQIMQTEQLYNQCARHMEAMREQYLQAGRWPRSGNSRRAWR